MPSGPFKYTNPRSRGWKNPLSSRYEIHKTSKANSSLLQALNSWLKVNKSECYLLYKSYLFFSITTLRKEVRICVRRFRNSHPGEKVEKGSKSPQGHLWWIVRTGHLPAGNSFQIDPSHLFSPKTFKSSLSDKQYMFLIKKCLISARSHFRNSFKTFCYITKWSGRARY